MPRLEIVEDRGVGHADRGHLELDESGNVTTGATDSQSDHVESDPEVLQGPDGPTWDERLEDAGITLFVRQHRAVLASVIGVAAVALVGTAVYVSTRPPPDDGVVAVTVGPAPTGESVVRGDPSVNGMMTFRYQVTPTRSTDTVRALELVGPAVRTSTVHARTQAAPGRPELVDVSVVLGCDDPRSTTATPDAYGLRVQRTDAFGRTVTGVVRASHLDEGSLDYFVYPCIGALATQGLSAQSLQTTVDRQGRTLYLTIVVRSTLTTGVSVETNDFTTDGVLPVAVLATGGPALIPSGGTGTIHTGLFVRDCSAPRLPDAVIVTYPLTGTTGAPGPGLPITATVPIPGTDRTRYGQMILAWPSGAQATIQAALNHLCKGNGVATTP